MADQSEIVQVELGDELVQVLRESVVVIARPRLAGLAESSAVVGDDAMARIQQDGELLLPCAAAQRIAVDQNDWRARAVVFVIEVDVA